jgi:hypothetical protein
MPAQPGDHPTGQAVKLNLLPVFIAAFALLLVGGILAFAFLEGVPATSTQTVGSYSLVGHHAWRELLRQLDFRVMVSRTTIVPYPDMPPMLYLAPDHKEAQEFLHCTLAEQIDKILAARGTVGIVCPKWQAVPDRFKPGWIGEKQLLALAEVTALCKELGLTLRPHRQERQGNTTIDMEECGRYQVAVENLQLMAVEEPGDAVHGFTPLAVAEEGMLAFSCLFGPGRLVVVSDPDIFTNHGLAQADNGLLAVKLVEQLAPSRKLLIDEVSHGLGKDLSILKLIVSYPYVILTLQVIAILVCLLLPISRPFQPPVPEPAVERSREEQVKSIAQITYAAGHHRHFLEKYLRSVVKQMQEQYPALARLEWQEQLNYLDRIAREKNIASSIGTLYDKVRMARQPQEMEKLVLRIYHYKQKLLAHPAKKV